MSPINNRVVGYSASPLAYSDPLADLTLPTVSIHGVPRKGCQTGVGGSIVTRLPT